LIENVTAPSNQNEAQQAMAGLTKNLLVYLKDERRRRLGERDGVVGWGKG